MKKHLVPQFFEPYSEDNPWNKSAWFKLMMDLSYLVSTGEFDEQKIDDIPFTPRMRERLRQLKVKTLADLSGLRKDELGFSANELKYLRVMYELWDMTNHALDAHPTDWNYTEVPVYMSVPLLFYDFKKKKFGLYGEIINGDFFPEWRNDKRAWKYITPPKNNE